MDELIMSPEEKNENEYPESVDEHDETGEADSVSDEDDAIERGNEAELRGLFEAVIFLSAEPLPISFFVKNFGIDPTQAKIIIDSLVDEYEERDGGIRLLEISKGYQFATGARYADQLRRIMGLERREKLSKGMLETLSIIAYKQPISIAEIDALRGVSSRMMVANLMKKNLIKPVGRKELPGRPLAYGTTDEFLKFFGLNKISDLPKLSEIKELTFGGNDQ